MIDGCAEPTLACEKALSVSIERAHLMIRKLVCCLTLMICPASLMAADSGAAMLHANGKTWVNGVPAPASAAVFPGDMVQTEAGSAANINSNGSTVAVLPGSLIKFESAGLGLSHGSVTVATSKKLPTHAGNVTVTPTSDKRTEFQVSESDGKVMIMARKGDVSIQDESGSSTISAGQQTTRYASFKDSNRGGGAAPAGGGGILDSPIVIGIGGAAVGALITWALVQGGKPFSPSAP